MSDPRKWMGLMKWSAKYADGSGTSDHAPMTEEDKEFLQRVLDEACLDPVERMKQINAVMIGEDPRAVFARSIAGMSAANNTAENTTSPDVERDYTEEELLEYKELLLDELIDIVSQIDAAKDYVQIGGLPVLQQLFASPHASLRAGAAEVLATVVQNNPPTQKAAVDAGFLTSCCTLMRDQRPDCQAKGLRGLSCLVRGNEEAENKFLDEHNGLDILADAIVSDNLKMSRKAIFFLRFLFDTHSSSIAKAQQSQLLPTLATCLSSDDLEIRESALEVWKIIAGKAPQVALDRSLGLAGIVEQRKVAIAEDQSEDIAVEKQLVEELAALLANPNPGWWNANASRTSSDQAEEQQPVLLLQPPILSGANPAP